MYEDLVAHLRECAKYDKAENTFNSAADAIENLDDICQHQADEIRELKNQWIPVTERLPEKHEWVLVRSKLVRMKTDFISNDGSWYTTPGVTHWMPLPEAPKDGE